MKRIEAYIRVNKLEEVKDALEEVGILGLSCEPVRGYGRQLGRTDKYRGSTYAVNLLPKMRVEVVVKDSELEPAIDAIVGASQTGEIGDGKIFVSEILEAVRVRTGERGDAALS
ncbi:MAG: P-II family nitrogen regulator [Fimbriimonas sp.]